VIGLAVGFALRDTVENYIASLLLSLRQPFARDDLVTIDGCEGRVVRLTARATILMTPDGNHTRIPNARVYKAVIVNYTRNPKRRFQFDVGVDTEQNLAAAQELAAATLAQMDGVLADPPPSCTVEQLGESNVVLRVFGWVDQTQAEYVKVRSEAIRLVKGAFDRAGVVMPEPIYNVRVGQLPGAPGSAPSAAAHADQRTAQRAESPRSKTEQISPEPVRAIDIARRDDLGEQIAADRGADDQDLLRSHAPKE
jgi:small-conductance mechanosensitive channel